MANGRWVVEWEADGARLRLLEPDEVELRAAAPLLAEWYDHPTNRALLGNTVALDAAAVQGRFGALRAEGARPFLLERDGAWIGDADLRHPAGGSVEVALLIGPPALQGQGLGARFGAMLCALAFGPLGLGRLYASVIPSNQGSLRMFGKLGFAEDASPAARAFADEPGDRVLALGRERFLAAHAAALRAIRCSLR